MKRLTTHEKEILQKVIEERVETNSKLAILRHTTSAEKEMYNWENTVLNTVKEKI